MKKINKKTVCVAMSGGVDSAVAAYLLKKAGYVVIGIFLKFWFVESENIQKENKCCSIEATEDARRVANKLKIPLYTLNYEEIFKKKIVDDFILEYLKGRTPNPCIRCNQYIKFGKLLDVVRNLNADYLATGHYAKIVKSRNFYKLYRPKDKLKDQTYFLYNLIQEQLKYLIFPLANLTKSEVRLIAKKTKLPVYQKPESQEICFIPNKFYGDFLKNHLKIKGGNIINKKSEILGKHEGLVLYTIGQRKGISVRKPGPYYVINKNLKNNELIVSNNPNDPALYSTKLIANKINWLSGKPPQKAIKIVVQIRYQHSPAIAKLKIIKNKVEVVFLKPQKVIAPGQSVVFYHGNELLGGGVIEK